MIARSRSFAVAFFMGVLVLSSSGSSPAGEQPGLRRPAEADPGAGERPDARQRRRPLRQPDGPARGLAAGGAGEPARPPRPRPGVLEDRRRRGDGLQLHAGALEGRHGPAPPRRADQARGPGRPRGGLRRDDRGHARRLDPARVLSLRLPRQDRRLRLADRPPGRRRSGSGRPWTIPGTSPRASPTGPSSGPTPAPRSSSPSTWPTRVSAKEVEPWLDAIDVIKKTKTEPKLLRRGWRA